MSASLHVLRPNIQLAGYLRIGQSGHRKLEHLVAAGRFPYRRVVFEAAHIDRQLDLLKVLLGRGTEVILDLNCAEMAAVGKHSSSSLQKLPWCNSDRPWVPADFGRGKNQDTAKLLAEFIVRHGVTGVLSPSHYLDGKEESWRSIDLAMTEALRLALDRFGGQEIAIDQQYIINSSQLKQESARRQIIDDLTSLPVQNLWLRTSGFGACSSGATTRSFIEAVRDLHQTNRPIVADAAGGFAGLASAAFGAVGGICHGVGQKEHFRGSSWLRPPSTQGGGGSPTRVYVHELDRSFKEKELDLILEAKGGRSRFACNDTRCCAHGSEDMKESADGHFIYQRHRQIEDLSSVSDSRRAEHFLLRHLDPAVRSARFGAKLKINDEQVSKSISDAKLRLVKMRDAMADLHENDRDTTRSRGPVFRGGSRAISAALGA